MSYLSCVRGPLLIGLRLLSALAAPLASAEDGATGETTSATGGSVVNPQVKLGGSKITLREAPVGAQGASYVDSGAGHGVMGKPIGVKVDAALLEWAKLHGQVSFAINGVNVGLCAGFRGTTRSGEITMAGRKATEAVPGMRFDACLGLQLGKLANLRDEFSVDYSLISKDGAADPNAPGGWRVGLSHDMVHVSNTVRADKIGGTAIGAYWEHRYESANTGGGYSTNQNVATNSFGGAIRF